jgi:hypothetical protein
MPSVLQSVRLSVPPTLLTVPIDVFTANFHHLTIQNTNGEHQKAKEYIAI